MSLDNKSSEYRPMYEKIAIDIAYSIANGEYKVNEMLSGRSSMASKYEASPETVRRAIKIIEEFGIVESLPRRGVIIKSVGAANEFLNEMKDKDRILSMREDVNKLYEDRLAIDTRILNVLDEIIEQSITFRNSGIIYPLEFSVTSKSNVVGRTIGSIQFWKHTGATIIGVKRNDRLLLSPGPEFIFLEGDTVYYVANRIGVTGIINDYINTPIEEIEEKTEE